MIFAPLQLLIEALQWRILYSEMNGGEKMKLTLLYIKNNIKYNRKSYMKLFVVFLMAFILIDAAVMYEDCKRTGYVNLTAGYNTPTGNFMTYDDSRLEFVRSYKYTKKAEVIGKTIPLHEYIDSINSRLFFYSPDHTTSYFLSETASDLGYMEVIVPISALKDLSSYISDNILTFPQFIDNHGDMLRFRVKKYSSLNSDNKSSITDISSESIIINRQTLQSLEELGYSAMTCMGFDFTEISNEILDDFTAEYRNTYDYITSTYSIRRSDIYSDNLFYRFIDSGTIFIIIISLLFGFTAILFTVKLKRSAELSDYNIFTQLGISPIKKYLMLTADLLCVWICTLITAFLLTYGIFHLILFGSNTPMSSYANMNIVFSRQLVIKILMFNSVPMLPITIIDLFDSIMPLSFKDKFKFLSFYSHKGYTGFVHRSSKLFCNAKNFTLPYALLLISRHKSVYLFLTLMMTVPVAVSTIYSVREIPNISGPDIEFSLYDTSIVNGDEYLYPVYERLINIEGVEKAKFYHKINNIPNYTVMELNEHNISDFTDIAVGNINDVFSGGVLVVDNNFNTASPNYIIGNKLTFRLDNGTEISLPIMAIAENVETVGKYTDIYISYGTMTEYFSDHISIAPYCDVYLNESIAFDDIMKMLDGYIDISKIQINDGQLYKEETLIQHRQYNIIGYVMSILIVMIQFVIIAVLWRQIKENNTSTESIITDLGGDDGVIRHINNVTASIVLIVSVAIYISAYICYYIYTSNLIYINELINFKAYYPILEPTICYIIIAVILLITKKDKIKS